MTPKPLKIQNVTLGGRRPLFILGPCVIESEVFVRRMARKIKKLADELGAQFVFKASYDKANRTSGKSFRGIGAREGCALLADIGREIGVPVTTDVHSPEEATIAAEFIDILQIPAFLCRQTDLIQAAAETGRVVNVKKGQFLAPWDVGNIAEKLRGFGNGKFLFHRAWRELSATTISWPTCARWRGCARPGFLTVFDATHSVQRPGGAGTTTGGDGALAPVLARAAVAAGCDGVFIETHENPAKAFSDGPNQIPLAKLPKVLRELQAIHEIVR